MNYLVASYIIYRLWSVYTEYYINKDVEIKHDVQKNKSFF